MNIQDFDLSVIFTRPDGSYVVNQGTYHVPNVGEWVELYAEVDAYSKEHPDNVMSEPEPVAPTKEELEAMEYQRQTSLEARLSAMEDALAEMMMEGM